MLSVKNGTRLSAGHKKSGAWGFEREEKVEKAILEHREKLNRVAESSSFLVVLASFASLYFGSYKIIPWGDTTKQYLLSDYIVWKEAAALRIANKTTATRKIKQQKP